MKVYAIYIITPDGRPMFTQIYQSLDHMPPDVLLTGLLTALQGISSELTNQTNAAEMFKLKGITFHLRSFKSFYIALVTDNTNMPSQLMNKIGWQFLQQYNDKIDRWMGRQSDFYEFTDRLQTILARSTHIDQSQSIQPSKVLDPINLLKLPKKLKATAKSILYHKEGTIEDISEYSGENIQVVESNIDTLVKMGFVGYYVREGNNVYFC